MFGKNEKKPETQVFVIYDSKVGNYRMPMFAVNHYDILRDFENSFRKQNPDDKYFTNAEDFVIYKIGEYSLSDGLLTPCKQEHIANLAEIKTIALRNVEKGLHQTPVGILPT